jgi:hypothetical protein
MRILLISIFVLISIDIHSSLPRNMYSFYGILPAGKFHSFSNEQTKLFKEKGVNEVISTENNLKSTYQINKNGYVKSIKTVIIKKEKETFVSESFYQYNRNNQVISIRGESIYQIYYDSLAYDNMGRTIYYKEVVKPKPTVKKKENYYNYSNVYILKSSNNNYVTLTDSSTQSIEFRLNNNNLLIYQTNTYTTDLVLIETHIDSVYIQKINESEHLKKYYYKGQKDSLFRIGKIEKFQDNQIQSIKTYQINLLDTTDNNYKIYTYDKLKLIRVENIPNHYYNNDITINTYYKCNCPNLKFSTNTIKREGLLQKKISIHYSSRNTTISTEKYEYRFY